MSDTDDVLILAMAAMVLRDYGNTELAAAVGNYCLRVNDGTEERV